jgi:uncharacterized protein (TIGR02145 family)
MKTIIFLTVMILSLAETRAQNFLISFTGTGASTTVDSVKVENLTQCTDTALGGEDILELSGTTGIPNLNSDPEKVLNIFPNPTNGNCTIGFEADNGGNTIIALFDLNGNRILRIQESLSKGYHIFSLAGLNTGVYTLKITSDRYTFSSKIISISAVPGSPQIEYTGTSPAMERLNKASIPGKTMTLKSGKSVILMQYNTGDTLKFTGKSGIYRTIIILIPTQSQTVTYNFTACTDADNNSYAVVQIGTQLWMAENLKTTKYRNGTAIPDVPDSAQWGNLTTGAYCDYHNLSSEGNQYGHLYNWYAATDSLNLCPVGWHVPTDAEWTILDNFLGGDSIAGGKLKENCLTRWASPNTGATNFSGFTALCANFRTASGSWSLAPNNDHDGNFWTSTSSNPGMAWFRGLRYCYKDVFIAPCIFKAGYSVRCVKD